MLLRSTKRNSILPFVVTVALTTFQLVRLVAFINTYGGIEHDSGWMLGIAGSLEEHGSHTTMVSTIANPTITGAVDVDRKYDVQSSDGRIWFFTGNGIGPSSVVPDAVILKLSGNDFWALRLGPLSFYTLFLLFAARLLYMAGGLVSILLCHGFIFF